MPRMTKVYWILFSLLLLVFPANDPASAAAGGVVIPPGFRKIDSAFGIELYEKDYPGGSPDFVQVIDLGQGASLKPLHGSITDPGAGKGAYGGNDAHFRSQTMTAYWQGLSAQDTAAFCVVNGQFFYMLEYPTRLPFPLKIDGQILTDGYGLQDFPDQKLMLELWPGKADIVALSQQALYASTAPDIIAGLAEDAPKAKKRFTGRTFIGLTGPNSDGKFETLMVFNTKTARQVDAAEVLKSFGAQKVMMLDGGGSTQLLCRGKSYIYSDRLVPQAIGIIAGDPGKIQAAAGTADLQAPPPSVSSASTPAANASGSVAVAPENQSSADKPVSQDKSATPSLQTQPQQTEQSAVDIQLGPPGENKIQQQDHGQRQIEEQLMLPILFNSPLIDVSPTGKTGVVNPDKLVTGPLSPTASPPPISNGIQGSVETPQPAAQSGQPLAAGITPVHLDDVLWVPASMAPVVMFLLLIIFKFRGRQE
jgi:hypothetical protein